MEGSERRGIDRRGIDRRSLLPKPPEPVASWLRHVKRNHGGHVSEKTTRSLTKFYASLKNTTILSKILILNPMVPDNLGACITPLIDITGKYSWLNSGAQFQSTDLTHQGLARKSGNSYLNTQFVPSLYLPSYNNGGLTVYISESFSETSASNAFFGSEVVTPAAGVFEFTYKNGAPGFGRDTMNYPNSNNVNGQANSNPYSTEDESIWKRGYLSFNRQDNTIVNIWKANEFFAHFDDRDPTETYSNTSTVNSNYNCYFFAANIEDDPNQLAFTRSSDRFSFCAVHAPFTETESQTFFNLIFALRQNLGGGWQGHF